MTLGDIIKEYRLINGMTMDDYASKSGLSKGYISMLEKNENPRTKKPIIPSLETIRQVADSIGMDFNQLILAMDSDQEVSLNGKGNVKTIAAHHDGDNWTKEELAEIEEFKKYVLSKRKSKNE